MAQALTKEATRADGNERLLQVVGIIRIGFVGVDEDCQTVHLILLDQHVVAKERIKDRVERQDERNQTNQQGQGRQHPFAACTAHADDDGTRDQHDQARAQVAHGDDGQERNGQHTAELNVVANGIDAAVVLRAKRGHKEDGDELGELNGLKGQADTGDLDPARHAQTARIGQARNLGREDHNKVNDEQRRREIGNAAQVGAPDEYRQNRANTDTQQVSRERGIGLKLRGRPNDDGAIGNERDGSQQHADVYLLAERAARGRELLVNAVQAAARAGFG